MGDNPSKLDALQTKSKLHNYSLDDCAKCVKDFSAAKGVNNMLIIFLSFPNPFLSLCIGVRWYVHSTNSSSTENLWFK